MGQEASRVISLCLPCISCFAWPITAPNAWQTAWCPRHTPSIGICPAKAPNHADTDARVPGMARPRGKEDVGGGQLFYFIGCNFIISPDQDVAPEFPGELVKVIGKAVVIVNQ